MDGSWATDEGIEDRHRRRRRRRPGPPRAESATARRADRRRPLSRDRRIARSLGGPLHHLAPAMRLRRPSLARADLQAHPRGIVARRTRSRRRRARPSVPAPATDDQHGRLMRAASARRVRRGKRPFDIDVVMRRIRDAVADFPDAAMFALRELGYGTLFQQLVACILSIRTMEEVSLPTALALL